MGHRYIWNEYATFTNLQYAQRLRRLVCGALDISDWNCYRAPSPTASCGVGGPLATGVSGASASDVAHHHFSRRRRRSHWTGGAAWCWLVLSCGPGSTAGEFASISICVHGRTRSCKVGSKNGFVASFHVVNMCRSGGTFRGLPRPPVRSTGCRVGQGSSGLELGVRGRGELRPGHAAGSAGASLLLGQWCCHHCGCGYHGGCAARKLQPGCET